MGETMARSDFSVNERGAWLESAARVVRDVVGSHRRRGVKITSAFADAALDLDTTPRRVRALYYRDGVWAVARDEYDRLMRRWGWHLDQQMAELARQAEQIRDQKAQLRLDLGDGEWLSGGTSLPHGQPGGGD